MKSNLIHVFGSQLLVLLLLLLTVSPTSAINVDDSLWDGEFWRPCHNFGNGIRVSRTELEFKTECLRKSGKCFALPYGAVGFASHILTYYCLIINLRGKGPLAPWKDQENQGRNLLLCGLQLVSTVIIAALAGKRCDTSDDFEMLTAWLIATSIASALAGVLGRGTWLFARQKKTTFGDEYAMKYQQPSEQPTVPDNRMRRREKYGQWLTWGVVGGDWLAGCILGLLAALNTLILVYETVPAARNVSIGFGVCILIAIVVGLSACRRDRDRSRMSRFAIFVLVIFLYCLFYIDWLVAAVMGNWAGVPTALDRAGQVLFWTYFAFKRLALFTT